MPLTTLTTSLKTMSGVPLSDMKAKKMTLAKMMRPNTPDKSLYMLQTVIRSTA
jgi:membrane protease subunit (stomatin/prohibitin family)